MKMMLPGLAMLLAPTAATAATPDRSAFDLQCALALQEAHGKVTEAEKGEIQAAMTFFFGRVDAQVPSSELETRVVAASAALQGKALGPMLEQCGGYMIERGKAWKDLGERMLAKEGSQRPR
ncbi:MAG: hypothetical protein AVDCRST_MAG09-345 [uncultured Sphingomonas sp.]|uniref:Uncharacterized protein n=1 Tax=uncultured Sphingomonas sp. TaxID=158754 RepID=A0A6J4SFZ8_9SPHN|nr:hypothetical protein [uncultured Sphingomonas sp.]CAA9494907.1 MAG: hypothetical protein AVDCRST_MAG09-345 [uncultured Sphingomonas sp.]